MIKKALSWIAITVLFFNFSSSFWVYETMSENDAATFLVENEIIKDHWTNWNEYRYLDWLTRWEWLKIFMKISWLEVIDKCDWVFSDLTSGWQCKYVEAWLKAWFISQNETFRPNDNFTKTEIAKLITKAKWIEKVQVTNNWQNDYMETLFEYWIIESKYYDYNSDAKRGWIFQIATSTIKKEEEIKKKQVEKKKTMSDETL